MVTDERLAERGVEVLKRIAASKMPLADADFIAQWVHDARQSLRAQGGVRVKGLFDLLVDAYVRGIAWQQENPGGEVGYAGKAAYDYADKITSSLEASPAPVSEEEVLAGEILAELVLARSKFPGKNVTFAALIEEVGELATATFEEGRDRVRKEAVQVAVMAMRMVLDGDHTFDQWREEKGLDALAAKGGQ